MKTILKSFFALFLLLAIWHCDKTENTDLYRGEIIQLKNSEEYIHDFKISGDEEGAVIKVQAKHFLISEISRNENTNWSVVYTYQPESDYIGTDSVEIETCTGGDGLSCSNLESFTFIFEVSN